MKNPKVLLIDDESAFINNISHILQLKGYDARVAFNGEEGLKALNEDSYDVVVLDLRMPGISGMNVLKEIKPAKITSPEVIILTGFASVDSGLEGFKHGAFDYVSKPVKIGDLVERIEAALERKMRKAL
jgi:two-component system, OmpR family, response regulator